MKTSSTKTASDQAALKTVVTRKEINAQSVELKKIDKLTIKNEEIMDTVKKSTKKTTAVVKKQTSKALKTNTLDSEKTAISPVGEVAEIVINEISPVEEVADASDLEEMEKINLPTFPAECYSNLPSLLSKAVEKGNSPEDKDILLLGSLVTLSACLPNISGSYDQREVFANLFLFVTAKASAGKGRLTLCRKLVEPIHKVLLQRQKDELEIYKADLTRFKSVSRGGSELGKPLDPPQRALIIPANSSATSVFQILNDNNGIGLLFETEGDTLAQAFKSEHGNYSDGFRKAFHHETISFSRRKDREFVELDKPRLSAVLSGTPRQVSTLIPSAENGLFSRFIYYYMNIRPDWNDVFAGNDGQTLDAFFEMLGNEFFVFYNQLNTVEPMHFAFSLEQQVQFNTFFAIAQTKLHCMLGDDYIASIRRLGLITFRIGMILTALRIMDSGDITTPLVCSDVDFQTAMAIVAVLIEHASFVFNQLPAERLLNSKGKTKKQLFFDALPPKFDRQGYREVASKLDIVPKTAEKYIGQFKKSGIFSYAEYNLYCK